MRDCTALHVYCTISTGCSCYAREQCHTEFSQLLPVMSSVSVQVQSVPCCEMLPCSITNIHLHNVEAYEPWQHARAYFFAHFIMNGGVGAALN